MNDYLGLKGLQGKVCLITGAGVRLGREMAKGFHAAGCTIAIHYRSSRERAEELEALLNQTRAGSSACFNADVGRVDDINKLVADVLSQFGRIDILINSASTFYPTPFGTVTEAQFDDLMGPNFKAVMFLTQACCNSLRQHRGAVINIVDINVRQPLDQFSMYCAAKAASLMLTKSLALELAPDVRVNSISPGVILWPVGKTLSDAEKREMVAPVPLQRKGEASDIVHAALFLATAKYVTGQDVAVCGGLSVGQKASM